MEEDKISFPKAIEHAMRRHAYGLQVKECEGFSFSEKI